jgi:hypothetical protein
MPREDLEEWADALYLGRFGCTKRKTFGAQAYYKGKKMAAFLYKDGLCVKVGKETFEAKRAADPEMYQPFDPMGKGKPMTNWLLIVRPETIEYEEELPMMEEAFSALG